MQQSHGRWRQQHLAAAAPSCKPLCNASPHLHPYSHARLTLNSKTRAALAPPFARPVATGAHRAAYDNSASTTSYSGSVVSLGLIEGKNMTEQATSYKREGYRYRRHCQLYCTLGLPEEDRPLVCTSSKFFPGRARLLSTRHCNSGYAQVLPVDQTAASAM